MPTATHPTPGELIATVFEHLDRHDVDGLGPLAADDIAEEWPMFGRLEGRAAVMEHFRALFAALPDLRLEVLRTASAGETVFVHWRATGTFTGTPLLGIRATGRTIDLHGTDCFTVRDGKVADNFVAFDGMAFATQAGVLPRHGSLGDRMMTSTVNARTRMKALLNL